MTVGTLPDGGKVEREIPTTIVSDHGFIYLDARLGQDSFRNTVSITEAINRLYPGAAIALLDGKKIGRAHVELQSRRNLVCRLLLEKKNKNTK